MPISDESQNHPIIVMSSSDNVGTALRDVSGGEHVVYQSTGGLRTVQVVDDIPFGHKVCLKPIGLGEPVMKYGEVIGRTTREIAVGEHVHVHNVEGIRGRGDLSAKGLVG